MLKYLLLGILRLFGILPLKLHYANARALAWLAGSLLCYRRDDVMINLSRSFPEKKYEELIAIRKEFYRHFADIIVETIWFGACSPKRLRNQRIVEIANPGELRRIHENSPGVVLLSSHCGNWELIGGITKYDYSENYGYITEKDWCVGFKRLHSKVWDEVMQMNRRAPLEDPKGYQGYLESDDVVRYIFRHRSDKKFYVFYTDQSPYQNSMANIGMEFMHQQTKSMTAAAALAKKFGMAAVYMGMKRAGRGHYTLEFTPICRDASTMETTEIMERYYRLLEKDIEEQPENYLWSHRRWKMVEK